MPMNGFGDKFKKKTPKLSPKAKKKGEELLKKAIISHTNEDLKSAENFYNAALKTGYQHDAIYLNLGVIYKNTGRIKEALKAYRKSIELNNNNPGAYSNLGNLYRITGDNEQALSHTFKSLELNANNPEAHVNLSAIYKDIGDLDKSLNHTLKSIELNPTNIASLEDLKGFIDEVQLTQENSSSVMRLYEILLNKKNISHQKLAKIFIQAFLPIFQEKSSPDSIVATESNRLKALTNDWRLRRSLTLMIPPNLEVEKFLTRLRRELLELIDQDKNIPEELRALIESLAIQCFLNEYIYPTTQNEKELVKALTQDANKSQKQSDKNLAIIGCYESLHNTNLNPEFIKNYAPASNEGSELVKTQYFEPKQEHLIKATLLKDSEITDSTSQLVEEMYEENPYPRFRYADHTPGKLSKPISEVIKKETTKSNLKFRREITSIHNNIRPEVLIAGCGTGNQIINASRYRNAKITAIDLSSNSLAYAIRKSKEYEMNNITFKRMDLLEVNKLSSTYDIIECSGVLHHMKNPAKGLKALNKQLRHGGFIKLGLYSEIARKDVVAARNEIKSLS